MPNSCKYRSRDQLALGDVRRETPYWDYFTEAGMPRWRQRLAEVREELSTGGRPLVQGALAYGLSSNRPDPTTHPGRNEGSQAKGRLRGKQPKLKPNQPKHLLELHDSGNYTQAEFAELFSVGRSMIYRTIERMRPKPVEFERPFDHALPQFPNTETSTPPFRAKG